MQIKNPVIEFISMVDGLDKIEECRPQPTNKFIPDWWKNIPVDKSRETVDKSYLGSVRGCPSFPDYFSNGYIIPMWCDTVLKYDKDLNYFNWTTSDSKFSWDFHTKSQLLDHTGFNFFGNEVESVFKAICPWNIVTAKGYSVYQMPLYYHTNNMFTVMPGIIDTDVHHIINQQVLLYSNEEVFIPKGTPFVQYIPFKREKYKSKVRSANTKDAKKINLNSLKMSTSFMGAGQYLKEKKKRDGR